MQKFISSSVFKNFKDAVELASQLGTGLEISRFASSLDNIDEVLNDHIEEMKKALHGFNSELSMHSFFIDLTPVSADPMIKKISRMRFEQCFNAAKYLGARTLVFHTGFNASLKFSDYYNYFAQEYVLFWKEFVKRFEEAGITAVLENVEESSPEFILNVIKEVNSPNLMASIDIGHANLHSDVPVVSWIKSYDKHLYHMHIHNNYGDDDSHSSVLKGTINIDEVFEALDELNLSPKMVFEIFEKNAVLESIQCFDEFFNLQQEAVG